MIRKKFTDFVSVVMSHEMREKLYHLSEVREVSMSTITRMAIDQYLKEHNQELEESHQEPTAIETLDSGDAQASGGA